MRQHHKFVWLAAILSTAVATRNGVCEDPTAAPLPAGVKAVWDLGKAYSRNDAHARADLHQRAVAVAAGRGEADQRAGRRLGLFQGPRLLAGNHRLHAEGLPDPLPPSQLERDEPFGRHRGLVPARDQRAEAVGRPPRRPLPGIPEFQRDRVRRWPQGGRSAVSGGRVGSDLALPARQPARSQPARRRHAAGRSHAHVPRQQRGQARQEPSRAARPVRRRLPRRHARGPADRRREGGYLGPQGPDHLRARRWPTWIPVPSTPSVPSLRTTATRSRSSRARRSRRKNSEMAVVP